MLHFSHADHRGKKETKEMSKPLLIPFCPKFVLENILFSKLRY